MILHFLRADFVTFRIYWVFLLIAEMVIHFGAALGLSDGVTTAASAYVCFLFGLLPLAHIIGSRYRTQHYMSRTYLLSLPIRREKLFQLLQVRSLVYWFPMIGELIFSTITPGNSAERTSRSIVSFIALLFLGLCGLVWFINNQIRTHLYVESISSYLKMNQRMYSWFRLIMTSLLEIMFFGFASALGEVLRMPWYTFAVPAGAALAYFSYNSARKRWVNC